ncbi:nuclear transport factor 2 family protein [Enterovirga sp.]|jgi:ketosteroid isomerase-like protein|uniref:nuclear transport factor 2 family protein n=1 Tax=Enterovirga sp. TaxID=2026350 RepID=UPI00261E188A|nr:nuclear transport factor 2 family protein [Enterovirga sp.]MDB5590119.1 hypothetical protein [Enterovirga sp.]
MQDRAAIETLIRSAYQARVTGDLDAMMGHFCDTAQFSLAGSPEASPVPTSATGSVAVREVLRRLTQNIEFLETTLLDLLIDPETGRVAVHSRVRVRGRQSGQEAQTEVLDLVQVENGRITSFRQFADTALAARLLGS